MDVKGSTHVHTCSTAAFLLLASALLAGCATPYGEAGLTGGAREKQLSADTYQIRAYANAYSPPGMLKPLVVKRAREVGKARGYNSFVIEGVDLFYDGAGMGYGADTRVKFVSQPAPSIPGSAYAVNAPDAYRPSFDAVDAARHAKLRSFTARDGLIAGLRTVPLFFDAVAASGYTSTGVAYLEPGHHRFFVHYWLNRSAFGKPEIGFVRMERRLEAGKSYVVTGRYTEKTIELWVEDEATKKPVGEVQAVR